MCHQTLSVNDMHHIPEFNMFVVIFGLSKIPVKSNTDDQVINSDLGNIIGPERFHLSTQAHEMFSLECNCV